MTTIQLYTSIKGGIEDVFDISRDIDFHMFSASKTNETAIAGTTKRKIGFNETVTWKGRHFGIYLKHTSKITTFERPTKFTDVMIKGHFMYFTHQHIFEHENGITTMTDILNYKTPYGIFGSFFDRCFLKNHLSTFLTDRNAAIKSAIENSNKSL